MSLTLGDNDYLRNLLTMLDGGRQNLRAGGGTQDHDTLYWKAYGAYGKNSQGKNYKTLFT